MLIRRAKVEDVAETAELISMAWEECAWVLAGTSDKAKVQKVIKTFYQLPNNILSYENVIVAEGKKGVAGLVLAYPSDRYRHLKRLLMDKLPQIYNADLVNFQEKVLPMFKMEGAKPGEYYIDSLAVYP